MARKKSRIRRVRSNTGFFKPSDAKTIEQFFIASLIQGAFTAGGAVIGTIIAQISSKGGGEQNTLTSGTSYSNQ